jgi:hypothetical protein
MSTVTISIQTIVQVHILRRFPAYREGADLLTSVQVTPCWLVNPVANGRRR